MKPNLKRIFVLLFFAAFIFLSCNKKDLPGSNTATIIPPPTLLPPPPPPVLQPPPLLENSCGNRPVINANLVQVGLLSSPRVGMITAMAGNKILFAGGYPPGGLWWNDPVTIDIYDFVNNTWSFASIFSGFRHGAAIASVDNKIFFAGGGDGIGDNQTSRVDIYDVISNTWSTNQLSAARAGLAAATVGNKVLFAGGYGYPDGSSFGYFDIVDVYDNTTNSWTTMKLSAGRSNLVATTSGSKIYFAGGNNDNFVSNVIDIYDDLTNIWTTSTLTVPKSDMGHIAAGNKIYWAGGRWQIPGTTTWSSSSQVEIRDLNTGLTSFGCILPRYGCQVVRKDDNLIFFTGVIGPYNGNHFEVYNMTTNTWSAGKLNQNVFNSAIISVNNVIYVAGGTDGSGHIYNEVWKLEF